MDYNTIMSWCAMATSLWGVFQIYTKVKEPYDKLKAQADSQAKDIEDLKKKVKSSEDADRIILKALVAILSGGDTQKTIQEINDYLINR